MPTYRNTVRFNEGPPKAAAELLAAGGDGAFRAVVQNHALLPTEETPWDPRLKGVP